MRGRWWPSRGVGARDASACARGGAAARRCAARRRDAVAGARGWPRRARHERQLRARDSHHRPGDFDDACRPAPTAINGWTVGRRLRRLHRGPLDCCRRRRSRSTSTGARPARSARRSRRRRARPTASASSTRPTATAALRPPTADVQWNGATVEPASAISHPLEPRHGLDGRQVTVIGDRVGHPELRLHGSSGRRLRHHHRRSVRDADDRPADAHDDADSGRGRSTSGRRSPTRRRSPEPPRMYLQAERSRSRPSRRQRLRQYAGLHPAGDGARRRDVSPATAFQPPGPGTYYWTVDYSGDSATGTLAASSPCGASRPSSCRRRPGGPGAAQARRVSPATARTGLRSSRTTTTIRATAARAGHWTFQTEANATGTVVLPWTYTGLHAWFQVTVGLEHSSRTTGRRQPSPTWSLRGPRTAAPPRRTASRIPGPRRSRSSPATPTAS